MSNLTKLEFVVLDILGKNYLSWILDAKIHLDAMNLEAIGSCKSVDCLLPLSPWRFKKWVSYGKRKSWFSQKLDMTRCTWDYNILKLLVNTTSHCSKSTLNLNCVENKS